MSVVRDALVADGRRDVPLHGALCFTTADLPRFKTLEIRGHLVLTRKGLAKRLDSDGPLPEPMIEAIAHTLARVFPRA